MKEKLTSPIILRIGILGVNLTQIDLITPQQAFSKKYNLKAQELPRLVEEFLSDQGLSLRDLTQIEVEGEDKSLTGYRIAKTVALTLKFVCNINYLDKTTGDATT